MTSHPTAQARGRGLGGPRRPRASVEWRGPQLCPWVLGHSRWQETLQLFGNCYFSEFTVLLIHS